MFQVRQGDVWIEETKMRIPKTAKRQDKCILAYGKVTGHCHQITSGAALFVKENGEQMLDVFDDYAIVQHEEHGPAVVLRGRYNVRIQREYAPDAIRNVMD